MLLLKRDADQHCGDLWSFPGGKIESGEKVKDAAKRELLEETGLTGKDWKRLGMHNFEYPDRKLSFMLFTCLCENTKLLACESEHQWASLSQLSEFPMPHANNGLIKLITQKDTTDDIRS